MAAACLERPIAFSISEAVSWGFFSYARRAVLRASSSVSCRGPMARLAAYSSGS